MCRSSRQSVSIYLGSSLIVQDFCKISLPVTANLTAQRLIMIALCHAEIFAGVLG
jgi:hypothetical protein